MLFISFFNANQTRILLCAVCFALITNIATIVVLFEQLERESLCDQQNEFNEFVEDPRKAKQIVIPKARSSNKTEMSLSWQKESSILDFRGGSYIKYEFKASQMKATDWKYYLDINIPQLSSCNYNNYASTLFISALTKHMFMREYNWFPQYHCPLYLQSEYRPIDLVPHIYQSQCAPFWPSDIVYLLSQILTPSMMAIQYGFSVSSTLWLANFVHHINVVDHRKDIIKEYKHLLKVNRFDLSNIEFEYQRMSKKYVERVDPKKSKIVDVAVIESVPEYHGDVLKYIITVLNGNNGILIIKQPDEIHLIQQLIDDLIPKHWLRYNSFIPKFLTESVPFSQEQYLEKYDVSMWITRPQQNPCDS